ncbi:hypothetical protein WJM97_12930 [Okeanomitos corallinicola TIOX110]|uniref:Uncharacterized protein n=1 Tax=Okeanomitos corallinicola TIOX110 TaxID=3133117 RepID=A0ABZ2UME6_9CYAN
MTTKISDPNASDLTTDDYIVIGLATCFYKEDGEVHQIEVIEPIPSAALEAIVKGIPTSYKFVYGTTLGSILNGDQLLLPDGFPDSAQFADEFLTRAFSAVRTYKRRTSAQALIPVGTTKTNLNYSTERKRILNAARVVNKEDNVKQHSHTHQVL